MKTSNYLKSIMILCILPMMLLNASITGAAAPQSCGIWNAVPSPNVGTNDNRLLSVAAVSTSDIWAVGYFINNSSYEQTLIEHWNGTSWQIVPSPNPGTYVDLLYSVTAVSASNIWAVGDYENFQGPGLTLIEHWNGTTWQVVPSPNSSSYVNLLTGVATGSASNIWAVGWYKKGFADPSQTLIERWNGAKWSIVPSPNPGGAVNALDGIGALKSNSAWAVGRYANSGGPLQTLTEQWNGSQWHVVPSPNPGSGWNELFAATALSTSNMWAVGFYYNNNGPLQTLIEHWNGKKWQIVSSPNLGPYVNELFSVAAVSAKNLWAVGEYQNGSGFGQTLIIHWNGTKWSVVKSPNPGGVANYLNSVVALKASNIWAVGAFENSGSSFQTLTEHYYYC